MKLYRLALLAVCVSAPALAVPVLDSEMPFDARTLVEQPDDPRDRVLTEMSLSFDDVARVPPGLLVAAQAQAPAPAPVPEPQTWALLVAGLGALGLALRRRR